MTADEGIECTIAQVEYTAGPTGTTVHVFGRDRDRNPVHLQVTGFRPYFYVPGAEAASATTTGMLELEPGTAYRSIRGEPLRRLYANRPTDVRDVRAGFHHYEADIPFTTRFLIDAGLHGGCRAPSTTADFLEVAPSGIDVPARCCLVDIECEDERGFPDPNRDRVICITCHDSYEDRYTTFLLRPEAGAVPDPDALASGLSNVCVREDGHTLCVYNREEHLFAGFAEYVQRTNPDIVSGWNVADFDVPYIFDRMTRLGLRPAEALSRLPGMSERNPLRGRVVFDLLEAYKKVHVSKRESYRLDAIAQLELGETKVRYTGTISDLWRQDPRLLVEYNIKDVELCAGINRKDSIVEFYREIARYVGCPLDRSINSSQVVDVYILRKAFGRFVLPSKGAVVAEEFEGATVFDPSRGVRENVIVLDLKSLYPMAMMTINASPETKDPKGELRAPNGIRFRAHPDGLTRSIIAELLEERDERKTLRNTFPFGSPEYHLLDLQQNVIKVIMNSYYGVSGYVRFRLYDREIGSAVTSVGRAIIEHTRKVIESLGYRVLYGDTDSCMIGLPPMDRDKTIAAARSIESALNASYGEFARDVLGADHHYFSIKFEKIYRRFFQAGRKKRYAGHLVWKEGKDVDEVDVVGFELRRSDSPAITKEVQGRVMEMILKGADYADVKAYLGDVIRRYRAGEYPLDEVGIPGGIGKNLDAYENDDAHIRGAKYANQYLGTSFGRGSKPKRVYIKNVTAKYPKTDVVDFEYGDQVPPEFVVDWETMLDKTIKQPISRIIESLGWEWADVDPSRTNLSQWGF
jgi:DNA polymerase I